MPDKSSKFVQLHSYNYNTSTSFQNLMASGYQSQILEFVTPSVLQVSSDDAADNSASTGATSVYVKGFDNLGNVIDETIATAGTSAGSGTKVFAAVTETRIASAGAGGTNAGILFLTPDGSALTAGEPDNDDIINIINTGEGSAVQSHFTVPQSHRAVVSMGGVASTFDLEIYLEAKRPNGAWYTVLKSFAGVNLNGVETFPAGTVIRMRCLDLSTTSRVSAIMEIKLSAI